MFSLSGKVNSQIPCFPCAVATLCKIELGHRPIIHIGDRQVKSIEYPDHQQSIKLRQNTQILYDFACNLMSCLVETLLFVMFPEELYIVTIMVYHMIAFHGIIFNIFINIDTNC